MSETENKKRLIIRLRDFGGFKKDSISGFYIEGGRNLDQPQPELLMELEDAKKMITDLTEMVTWAEANPL